jgi:hypothetical protein
MLTSQGILTTVANSNDSTAAITSDLLFTPPPIPRWPLASGAKANLASYVSAASGNGRGDRQLSPGTD